METDQCLNHNHIKMRHTSEAVWVQGHFDMGLNIYGILESMEFSVVPGLEFIQTLKQMSASNSSMTQKC